MAPWQKATRIGLFAKIGGSGGMVAMVETGALGNVISCTGKWCRFAAAGVQGWIKQNLLWGIYPGERFK